MLIYKLNAEVNGAHRNQTCSPNMQIPDGWVRVADNVETANIANIAFVKLTLTDGVVTSIEDDTEARIAQEAQPGPSAPYDETALLKAKVAAMTQSNQMLEDCLAEMAGIVYA